MKLTGRLCWILVAAVLVALSPFRADAHLDGNTGNTFTFVADSGHILLPDGANMLFWGFGSRAVGEGVEQPQYPGPTLIVTEGETITVNLVNKLPEPVSIIFPGLEVLTRTAPVFPVGDKRDLVSLAPEAAPSGGVQTYQFRANRPGTFYYQSGTNLPTQTRMGLFGAIVVRPKSTQAVTAQIPATFSCPPVGHREGTGGVNTITSTTPCTKSFTTSAYTPASPVDASTAYDREILYLVSEMDPNFQHWKEFGGSFDQAKWKPNYWFINGRAAPDTMGMPMVKGVKATSTGNAFLPNQPYNCMPLFHPGERVLLRFINMGHEFHPLHTHGNHMRVIALDGNPLSSTPGTSGVDLSWETFTIGLAPGKTMDAIFTWTGEKMGWDVYDHAAAPVNTPAPYEYLADHAKRQGYQPFTIPLFGAPSPKSPNQSLPVILPTIEETISGLMWSGSPYMGLSAPLPPGEGGFNPFNGYFFMWHSHAERELTNNNLFPGGLLTMAGIVPWPMPGDAVDPATGDNLNAIDEIYSPQM